MFPFSTGYAHLHPLNTDVKEHRSGPAAENPPQHPAVPGSTRLLRTSRAIAAGRISATSHSEQCESKAKEPCPGNPPLLPRQPWCCGRSGFYVVFFEGLEEEANIHLYLYSFAIFVNGKKDTKCSQGAEAVCPGLSEPFTFMWFSAVCGFKRLIPIWQIQLQVPHCDLWAGASVAIPVPPWEKEENRLK